MEFSYMYEGEAHRCVDRVELREQLQLQYNITDDEYRSEHDVSGEIRGVVTPDREVVRSRTHPPTNPIQAGIRSVAGRDDIFAEGYPGTELIAAVTMVPPTTQRDEQLQSGFSHQEFTVDGIPKNGTVSLDTDWEVDSARKALSEDKRKAVAHEYSVEGLPSDQLPIVIRANLRRDAREHLENIPSTIGERDANNQSQEVDPTKVEGLAALSVAIEYREDTPETIVAGGGGQLNIKNFRLKMQCLVLPPSDGYLGRSHGRIPSS